MEGLLGLLGLPRERWEAPFEYLERVLVTSGASAATDERLTDLFEVARFSSQPVDEAMRAEALELLRILRREIEGARVQSS